MSENRAVGMLDEVSTSHTGAMDLEGIPSKNEI